jgi:hypothetical protein
MAQRFLLSRHESLGAVTLPAHGHLAPGEVLPRAARFAAGRGGNEMMMLAQK